MESEDKSKTWKERKGATLKSLKEQTMWEAKFVALGDKLSNIRCIYGDYMRIGEKIGNGLM